MIKCFSGILQENIIKKRRTKAIHTKMEVDILIDRITDCLIDTRTGEEVETEYRRREILIKPKDYKGWNLTGVSQIKMGMVYTRFS